MIARSSVLISRGKRTRATLLGAGREAFEEHRYDAVRIDDACRSRAWPTAPSIPG